MLQYRDLPNKVCRSTKKGAESEMYLTKYKAGYFDPFCMKMKQQQKNQG